MRPREKPFVRRTEGPLDAAPPQPDLREKSARRFSLAGSRHGPWACVCAYTGLRRGKGDERGEKRGERKRRGRREEREREEN